MASTTQYAKALEAFREAGLWFSETDQEMKKLCEGLEALTAALQNDITLIRGELLSIQNDVNRL